MREPGKKSNYLIPWGIKKLSEGWTLEQVFKERAKISRKSLKEIKEFVKQ
jgi:hypothetical protein